MPVDPDLALLVVLLSFALVLIFEFINGFHDTANAVATVIYTHSLKPAPAVIWSGFWNFLGVALSGGTVALSIFKLVPPDLFASDPASGMAALLAIPMAAIIWNFSTWYVGLPASSSHTLIGAIFGVGLVHSWMIGHPGAGLNWSKVTDICLSLLISPLVGFIVAALIFRILAHLVKSPLMYRQPLPETPPPRTIRGLLILTSAGISFAHGTNDGQKSIGLLMLILITMMPDTYALGADGALVIPLWIKLLAALVLGGGTMVGWRRIVVTIGEKIGKAHMNYAQGASAEITAALTIQAASLLGLPVSTTHVLSSGVAGAMFAQGTGLQTATVKKILTAWILTLPASIFVASCLFGGLTYALIRSLGLH